MLTIVYAVKEIWEMDIDIKMLEKIRDLQLFAYAKGLVLLMGEKYCLSVTPNQDKDVIGFAVLKEVGKHWFAVMPDGQLEYQRWYDGPFGCWTVWYYYSFEEAKKVISEYSFEEHVTDNPKFYGLIRVYENEEFKIEYTYQKKMLDDWALRAGIEYEDIYVCQGGYGKYPGEPSNMAEALYPEGAKNLNFSCSELFGKLKSNDVLCITDDDRLDGDIYLWLGNVYLINGVGVDGKLKKYQEAPEKAVNEEEDGFPF